jgi:hypothetical protein
MRRQLGPGLEALDPMQTVPWLHKKIECLSVRKKGRMNPLWLRKDLKWVQIGAVNLLLVLQSSLVEC